LKSSLTVVFINFNQSAFVEEALNSILEQKRNADEIVVIDDCSTDESVAIISNRLRNVENARVLVNAKNSGVIANLNRGIDLARGDFIHFAAADDLFYSGLYETGVELLEAHPEAALFSARSDIIDHMGNSIAEASPSAGVPIAAGFVSPEKVYKMLMRHDGWFMGNTVIYRKIHLVAAGGFRDVLGSFTDGFLCRYLALECGACFSFEILAAWRRMNSGFATSTLDSFERFSLLIANGEKAMKERPDVFPRNYVPRWVGRQRFEFARRSLSKSHARHAKQGVVMRVFGILVEKFHVAFLLVKLRPWDTISYARQWVQIFRNDT
jgi:glycosyltransferase involved in cell wall biosynthesis